MTDRELIKEPDYSKAGFGKPQRVINTLNKQPEPEPVAWMYNGNLHEFDPSDWAEGEVIPLFTAPPQREWQGLTDEEAAQCWNTSAVKTWQAIEAKLKEKNS